MIRSVPLPPILIKVGKKQHIEQFVNEGIIKFGTYADYRKTEDHDIIVGRSDSLEGLGQRFDGTVTLTIGERSIEVPNGKLNIFQNQYSHLFCMYGFARTLPFGFKIDGRMQCFGDTAVIFNSKAFLMRMTEVFSMIDFEMDYVKYYPEKTFLSNLGPYSKREGYSYQYEYRIATNLSNEFVNIGDVLAQRKDTLIVPSSKLSKLKLDIRPY